LSKRRKAMKERIGQRLEELRSEFEAGQTLLADLENRQTQTRSSLLRISGAIQVLEEMLNEESLLEQSVETSAAI
jgi:hypothetical protein